MTINSPAFEHGGPIPERYTRFGENHRPPLLFCEIPPEAQSLALIVDDPDSSRGTFTHWILFNLRPQNGGLAEDGVTEGATEGHNDWDEPGYGGPRPRQGGHRYFFRLYALDRRLDLPEGAHRPQVIRAMGGHVIDQAELMGRFATPVQAERDAG